MKFDSKKQAFVSDWYHIPVSFLEEKAKDRAIKIAEIASKKLDEKTVEYYKGLLSFIYENAKPYLSSMKPDEVSIDPIDVFTKKLILSKRGIKEAVSLVELIMEFKKVLKKKVENLDNVLEEIERKKAKELDVFVSMKLAEVYSETIYEAIVEGKNLGYIKLDIDVEKFKEEILDILRIVYLTTVITHEIFHVVFETSKKPLIAYIMYRLYQKYPNIPINLLFNWALGISNVIQDIYVNKIGSQIASLILINVAKNKPVSLLNRLLKIHELFYLFYSFDHVTYEIPFLMKEAWWISLLPVDDPKKVLEEILDYFERTSQISLQLQQRALADIILNHLPKSLPPSVPVPPNEDFYPPEGETGEGGEGGEINIDADVIKIIEEEEEEGEVYPGPREPVPTPQPPHPINIETDELIIRIRKGKGKDKEEEPRDNVKVNINADEVRDYTSGEKEGEEGEKEGGIELPSSGTKEGKEKESEKEGEKGEEKGEGGRGKPSEKEKEKGKGASEEGERFKPDPEKAKEILKRIEEEIERILEEIGEEPSGGRKVRGRWRRGGSGSPRRGRIREKRSGIGGPSQEAPSLDEIIEIARWVKIFTKSLKKMKVTGLSFEELLTDIVTSFSTNVVRKPTLPTVAETGYKLSQIEEAYNKYKKLKRKHKSFFKVLNEILKEETGQTIDDILSTRFYVTIPQGKLSIVLAIDVSGSMTDGEIIDYVTKTVNVLQDSNIEVEKIIVAFWSDESSYEVFEKKKPYVIVEGDELESLPSKVAYVLGKIPRGGTYPNGVVEWLYKKIVEENIINENVAILFITDTGWWIDNELLANFKKLNEALSQEERGKIYIISTVFDIVHPSFLPGGELYNVVEGEIYIEKEKGRFIKISEA